MIFFVFVFQGSDQGVTDLYNFTKERWLCQTQDFLVCFFPVDASKHPLFSMRSIYQSSRPLLLLRKFGGLIRLDFRKIWSSDVPSISSGYLDVTPKKPRMLTSLCPFNLNRGEASVPIPMTFQTMTKLYEFMLRCLRVTSTVYSDCRDTLR